MAQVWRQTLARKGMTQLARKIHPDLFTSSGPIASTLETGSDGSAGPREDAHATNVAAFQALNDLVNNGPQNIPKTDNDSNNNMESSIRTLFTVDAYVLDRGSGPTSTSTPGPSSVRTIRHSVTQQTYDPKEYPGVDRKVLAELEQRSVVASLWDLCEKAGVDLAKVRAPDCGSALEDRDEYTALTRKVAAARDIYTERTTKAGSDWRFGTGSTTGGDLRTRFQQMMKARIATVDRSKKRQW